MEENTERKVAIEIKDLHKSYGNKDVLLGINLEVYQGELFGFIGRNGVGKSTTIDCMVGSKQFNEGSILLNGYDILKEPIEAKKCFGYVASEPTCYEVMTGYDFLEFIASIYHVDEQTFSQNYHFLLKKLNFLESDLNLPISTYSHGMKQKICLMSSLLHNPDIWILDEPTVGLDIMAVEAVKSMMLEYARHQKTVFVTSHNIELVAKICDRVAIINKGVVVALFDLNKDPNKRLQLERIFLELCGGLD